MQPENRSCSEERFARERVGRNLLHRVITYWAERKPADPAVISYDRGKTVDWATLERVSSSLALELFRLGFRKGDVFAVSLPMSLEHIFLEYACFRIGVIHAPLDLRLPETEVLRCLALLRPKGYCPATETAATAAGRTPAAPEHVLTAAGLAEIIARGPKAASASLEAVLSKAAAGIEEDDGAQAIFTTGSTGSPKAALLSHRNILCQNFCLGAAFEFERERILLNLPPSHVGGQAEVLMTSLFCGGTAVALESFDPARSLDAVERYRATMIGQIPAMFEFEWRMHDFDRFDLSSLRKAVYGGQQVTRPFLERMARMAPRIATGLGLTETAGFCTYTPLTSSVDDILAGVGHDMPIFPMSIRREMREDGKAGDPLPDGETGHVCFRGPQVFLGYLGDAAATARTVSSDGWLYTGDLGRRDERGLHFSGRAKWVIKPAGCQIFPGDVEEHFCALDKVAACGVAGAEHRLLSEAIVAFVEKKPGAELSTAELRRHARALPSYMRPLHYVVLEPGALPLNRAAKLDYLRLGELARREIERLRARGGWDR